MNILALLPRQGAPVPAFAREFSEKYLETPDITLVAAPEKKEESRTPHLLVSLHTEEKKGIGSWMDNKFKYSPVLKKWQIARIVMLGSFIRIETSLPQCLVCSSMPSLTEKEKSFLQQHDFSFITYSQEKRALLQEAFPGKPVHIFVPEVSPHYLPLGWDAAALVKEKYADGEEYFLVDASGLSVDDCIHLLKGFSIFKKWQKSGMKILFILQDILPLQEKIANYKYRDDVRLVNSPDAEARAAIIASAYSCIHLPHADSDLLFALQAIHCQVPLLLKKDSTLAAWLHDNAFLVDNTEVETLGQAIITMYKAENLRANYIDYYEKWSLPVVAETGDFLFHS